MPVLIPCPSCARHIAVNETRCPFCASVIVEDLAARAVPANTRRLRRFAMFTFATTAATAVGVLAACGESEMSTAFYGAPCTDGDGACTFQETDSGGFNDDGSVGTLYGLPGFLDSGSDADAAISDDSGDARDASSEDAD